MVPALHETEGPPGFLPEVPVDADVLPCSPQGTLEAAHVPALIADLEHGLSARSCLSRRVLLATAWLTS